MTNVRKCDVENLADFHRYYYNSWVGWHDSNSSRVIPVLVCQLTDVQRVGIRELNKDDISGTINITDIKSINWGDIQKYVDFGRPDIGMANDRGALSYFSYSTSRAPHKGFRPREASAHVFNSWEVRHRIADTEHRMYAFEWFVFNPEYPSLGQAILQLNEGETSGVPLSKTVGIYSVSDSPNPILAYKRWTVGYVVNETLVRLNSAFEEYRKEISRQIKAEVELV